MIDLFGMEAPAAKRNGGLRPADAAHALEPHVLTMAGAADALVRTISGTDSDAQTIVRIAASETVGAEVSPAILANSMPVIQA